MLLAAILGPRIALTDDAGNLQDVRDVRCYAYAPPCVLSVDLARGLSGFVTSVIVADDMVPRFGISTTIEVKEALAAVHREPGLIARIRARTVGSDGSADGNVAWAQSILHWIYNLKVTARSKLYPAGLILHLCSSSSSSSTPTMGASGIPASQFTVGVDQLAFRNMILSGTSMWSSHMPGSYSNALIGDTRTPFSAN